MDCFTLECEGDVFGKVTYQSSMGLIYTELRCKDCIQEVYANLDNIILEVELCTEKVETFSEEDSYVIFDESEKTELEIIEDLEVFSPVVFKHTITVGTPYYTMNENELTSVTVFSTNREKNQGVREAYDILCERLGVSMDKLEAEYIIESDYEFANSPWDSIQELRDFLSSLKSVMSMSVDVYSQVIFTVTLDIPFNLFEEKVKSYYPGLNVVWEENNAKVILEF